MKVQAAQAATYFLQTPPDRAGLTGWLQRQFNPSAAQIAAENSSLTVSPSLPQFTPGEFTLAVDQKGMVLASIGNAPPSVDGVPLTHLSSKARAVLQAALMGETDARLLVSKETNGALLLSAPILGLHHQVVGALLQNAGITPSNQWLILNKGLGYTIIFLLVILVLSVPIILFAALIGTVFGFLTARSFTRRIKKLFSAADNWSRGDFSASANDASSDELGQLAQRLNSMAEQLQNLLFTRQKLAGLEERNRLARDLHDSVKQQVFAVSMQVRAAKQLVQRNPDEAQEHLNEAEQLVQQTQQELTALVRELRPLALENKGLVSALRELVTDWSRQTGVKVSFQLESEQTVLFPLEEALFRVAQEALANVARHSEATCVHIFLCSKQDNVKLSITDNGRGFDAYTTENAGLGLCSMRERIEALGGWIEVTSKPGNGTSIVVQCGRVYVGV